MRKGSSGLRTWAGAGLALALASPAAQAYVGLCCAKCGGNMPMNIPGGGVPATYEFRFKVSPMFMHMDGLRDGTDEVSSDELLGSPQAGGYMAVPTSMDMTMVNLAAGYSFTDDFFAGLMFMWQQNRMPMELNAMMESRLGTDGFTMHSEGMGDTMLMTKYRLHYDDPLIPTRQVSLLAGLSLPTGSIGERNRDHPMPARRDELLPYGMQLGSGTWDPILGLLYQGSRSPYWWGANATYTARVHDNERGYRLGDRANLDLYAMYQVRSDTVLQLQLNAEHSQDIAGEADAIERGDSGRAVRGDGESPYLTPLYDPDHYGGTSARLTGGFQWQPAPMHIVDLQGSVPVYQDLNGPQMQESYRVMATYYFELPTRASVRYQDGSGREQPGGAADALGF
ncbi:hypothetical protein AN478_05920 [Thiohalorhabdus denitrificans]|uniref:MetA-pathway of phenol degradation n=1 Tax=Thiohalorhabdus denitrificans TaxID=381306 RepID=A0A0P9CNK3_9GAMM|nr:hypothetical protein [Thiohalorhabdus denitrificans]KPV40691.1 hypothetical protein AN478_05920 [Thiohalorhabdus denitrificans]SCY46823.1 hypothetical protein SAMN05661077_2193 [Thiohalorhabdus denitrificans]